MVPWGERFVRADIKTSDQRLWRQVKLTATTGLHEEWRLVLFVCAVGVVCAVSFLMPQTVFVVVIGGGAGALYALRHYGAKAFPTWLAAGIVFAALISNVRLAGFEPYDFEPEQFVSLSGHVDQLDIRPEKSTRLVLTVSEMQGFRGDKTPKRLRLAVRTQIESGVQVGTEVHLSAIISPVGGSLVPGGYDFGRAARHQHIDAQGYAASAIVNIAPVGSSGAGVKTWLDGLRYRLADTIQSAIPGQPGALAVALTLGLRHGISDATSEVLRRAGLSHLLAISGLHMGIVAAAAFFMFELVFAAIPAIALRIMPRKLAVVPAWLMAVVYLLLSGGSTATIRAFIMVTVAMLALLTSRRVLSLRSVALAALAILVLWPESVLSVGFQMSFAATTGLIAFYERFSARPVFAGKGGETAFWRRALGAVVMIGVTSLVAQASVAPFALYHFQALSVVGVVANIIVLPIVSFLVMPLLLLTLVLAVFSGVSLVGWLLHPLLSFILDVAAFTASPDYSTLRIEPMPEGMLVLLTGAFMVLVLLNSKRGLMLAGAFIAMSFAVPSTVPATILIAKTGGVIALHHQGEVFVSGGRKSSFKIRSWRGYWGEDPFKPSQRLKTEGNLAAKRFDLKEERYVTHVKNLSAVHGACAAGGVVVLPKKYARYCKGAALIIEKEFLKLYGPAGLKWTEADKPILKWANPPDN